MARKLRRSGTKRNFYTVLKNVQTGRNANRINALRGFWPLAASDLHGERQAKARIGAGF
jgi:hypothetical protein